MAYDVTVTVGHVLRHAPSRQGVGAALVDVAQDLLLRHLHDEKLLDHLVFKGGTALRKLYAGHQGRFSLDLDFSVRSIGDDVETIVTLLEETVQNLTLGPFRYGITTWRGKRTLTIDTALGSSGQLQLSVPAPDLDELATDLVVAYGFLADLDADERAVAALNGGDRDRVLRMLAALPGGRLSSGSCW